MYVEADNPSKEKLKSLLEQYGRGELLSIVDEVPGLLKTYDRSIILWNVLGAAYLGINDFLNAGECFKKTVELKPDFAEGYCNLGLALHKQNKLKLAEGSYKHALKLKPDFSECYNNLGHVYRVQKKHLDAIKCYEEALKFDPKLTEALIYKFQQQAHICDWRYCAEYKVQRDHFANTKEAIEPFSLISKEDNLKLQKKCAQSCAQLKYRRPHFDGFGRPSKRPQKLRIGYFSSDYFNHPVMHLMTGVFDTHNRDLFEILAFYIGPDVNDEMTQRAKDSVDEFIDIRSLSDEEAAALARSKKIDIAIDMNGYSGKSRSGLFAYGAAPIQINYLGYPSTMGADFIDYIIGDEILIPEESRGFYSEKIVYMPHTYMPNDNKREISDKFMSRADFGLPDNAFVFCCFNNNYKLSPREFDIWMRLLEKVDGSVLWLTSSNEWAEKNLQDEAEKRGINRERLVFAQRVEHLSEHLARHRLADLFVDTFHYNAHVTAADALWAGLPVVTRLGNQFAARVAASLLNAVGLPELITESDEDYEALALELAMNNEKLAAIKQKLLDNRLSKPLFDTKIYTRHIENAYDQAFERWRSGLVPTHIKVEE